MCENYLLSHHKAALIELFENKTPNKHYSININFLELFENDPNLGNDLLKQPEECLRNWDKAVLAVQCKLPIDSKANATVHCRIYDLPVCPELHRSLFPKNEDADRFLQITGTVVRMTSPKLLEYERHYICTKCKHVMIEQAEYDRKYMIKMPKKCENPDGCKSTSLITGSGELNSQLCKDYQEVKMQENVSKLGIGSIPSSMWVTLEDDLVDSCKPGDNVTVSGIVKRRWGQFSPGKKIDIELVLKANHIQINNNNGSAMLITPEIRKTFETFWETYSNRPLVARDIILKSFCPQIYGLHMVKLAMAVTLAGGSHLSSDRASNGGVSVRSQPHLLLVGDPGTGKSHLLRFASRIIPRAILTTGVGSTAAGLTVTAVMEDGEWQLEGGALVLADGGICCIDEFNSMKEHDRTSIHEAMEQQTISVAKASIVCKLNTRCSILAATNPKGNIDPSQPLSMNIALPSPLLSRFDLVLLIKDAVIEDWDNSVTDYILNGRNNYSKLSDNGLWSVDILQVYFAVIKKSNPMLTSDTNRILSNYYQAQRRINSRNKARTTVRLLDSLVRLSQGHARLMFHQQVEIIDAVVAIALVETAMETDSSVLNLHFNVHSLCPDNPMETYRELVEIVLKKLDLHDMLTTELHDLNEKMSIKFDEGGSLSLVRLFGPAVTANRVESRYFHQVDDNKEDDCSRSIELGHQGGRISPVDTEDEGNLKRERISDSSEETRTNISISESNNSTEISGAGTCTKKIKLDKFRNDLAMFKFIPSVNDNFPLNDILLGHDNNNDVDEVVESTKENNGSSTEEMDINTLRTEKSLGNSNEGDINLSDPESSNVTTTLQQRRNDNIQSIFESQDDLDSLDLNFFLIVNSTKQYFSQYSMWYSTSTSFPNETL